MNVNVVTGAGSGIGQAIAANLPKDEIVVIVGRTASKLKSTADKLNKEGAHVYCFGADCSKRSDVEALANYAKSLGKVTRVFHAAGVSGSMTDRESIIRINALGTVYVNQEFYKVMDGGCIVDVSSNSAYILPKILVPSKRVYNTVLKDEEKFVRKMKRRCWLLPSDFVNRQIAYMISKNFAKYYSQKCSYKYMKEKSIRVFSISPGYVNTPMTEKEKGKATDILLSYSPTNKGADPNELATIMVDLSKEDKGYLIGVDILVDGGCINNGYKMMTSFLPFNPKKSNLNW